jgi:hypothetical protein
MRRRSRNNPTAYRSAMDDPTCHFTLIRLKEDPDKALYRRDNIRDALNADIYGSVAAETPVSKYRLADGEMRSDVAHALYTPPRQVRVGETFMANGDTKTIKVIVANKADEDMPDLGIRAGQWICSAAQTLKDMPLAAESGHTGTWLYIAHCLPSG